MLARFNVFRWAQRPLRLTRVWLQRAPLKQLSTPGFRPLVAASGLASNSENKEEPKRKVGPSNILDGHHAHARSEVRKARSCVAGRKVIDIKAKREDLCLESYPCQGHEGAIFTFEDGSTLFFPTSSVAIGALEAYYFPQRMKPWYLGSHHFLNYITKDFAKELAEMRRNDEAEQ